MISSDAVFVAHSSWDRALAKRICGALESRGIRCWISSRDIGPGENHQDAISAAIHAAKFMILVLNENASQSNEIEKQLALAARSKTVVIPVRAEPVKAAGAFAYKMAARQSIDLSRDWEGGIDSICRRIERGGRAKQPARFWFGGAILVAGLIFWLAPVLRETINKPPLQNPLQENAPAQLPRTSNGVGQSPSNQAAPVAQRAVLYDEDPSDRRGRQYAGTVVWRTEQTKGSGSANSDLAVRADVDIPERKLRMTMSFRRNADTSLPASHTAELTFILPPDFDGGGVSNVPGLLMKSNEQARGTPLAGVAVKVTDSFFLVGLSNVDADRARNLQLLKERAWFDVPLVYANQRRAIIAIDKGAPGERAFQDAFAAWGE
jgi:TIR domain